ncbi:hypothetical protein HK096_011406, partial [Nowakowskiella sp. JEL0078]
MSKGLAINNNLFEIDKDILDIVSFDEVLLDPPESEQHIDPLAQWNNYTSIQNGLNFKTSDKVSITTIEKVWKIFVENEDDARDLPKLDKAKPLQLQGLTLMELTVLGVIQWQQIMDILHVLKVRVASNFELDANQSVIFEFDLNNYIHFVFKKKLIHLQTVKVITHPDIK